MQKPQLTKVHYKHRHIFLSHTYTCAYSHIHTLVAQKPSSTQPWPAICPRQMHDISKTTLALKYTRCFNETLFWQTWHILPDWDVFAISSVQLFAHKKRGCKQTQMQVSYHQSFQKGKSVTDPTTSPSPKSCTERSLLPDVASQTPQPRHSGETFSLPCHHFQQRIGEHTHTHTHTDAHTNTHACMHTHACTQTTCTHTHNLRNTLTNITSLSATVTNIPSLDARDEQVWVWRLHCFKQRLLLAVPQRHWPRHVPGGRKYSLGIYFLNASFLSFLLQNHSSIFGIREAGLWTGGRKTELLTRSFNLHTERLVSFLQTTACEVLQGVHVLKGKKERRFYQATASKHLKKLNWLCYGSSFPSVWVFLYCMLT